MKRNPIDERERPAGRRLLLTGTPGCGKRSLGNLLAATHPFVHVDLDSPRFTGHDSEAIWAELEAKLEEGADAVATWTPSSKTDIPLLEVIQENGFEWIWLDGDFGAALHAAFGDLDGLAGPRLVDAFEPDGTFRPLEPVLAEILEPMPSSLEAARSARRPLVAQEASAHRA